MMKADIRWLDNPEIFRVNREDAHSDHAYYASGKYIYLLCEETLKCRLELLQSFNK